jgi:hypothetical protein
MPGNSTQPVQSRNINDKKRLLKQEYAYFNRFYFINDNFKRILSKNPKLELVLPMLVAMTHKGKKRKKERRRRIKRKKEIRGK